MVLLHLLLHLLLRSRLISRLNIGLSHYYINMNEGNAPAHKSSQNVKVHDLFHKWGNGFPLDVIEIEMDSYKEQSKTAMCVASMERGNYAGLQKICQERWQHIKAWHIIIPGPRQLKIVDSLNRPHYSINEAEANALIPALLLHLRRRRAKKLFLHQPSVNYVGKQLILLIQFPSSLLAVIKQRYSLEVSAMVRRLGVGDKNRLNHYVDGGYSGHQNATDRDEMGIVRPRLLKHTKDEVVVKMFCWLTSLLDETCQHLGMDPLFLDEKGERSWWAKNIHPKNSMEANRHALGSMNSSYQVHEDGNNGLGNHA